MSTWKRPRRIKPRSRDTLTDYPVSIAWQPRGSRLAVAAIDGPITLFDSNGARLRDWAGHRIGTTEIAWAPDGLRLSSAGQDGRVRIWDPSAAAAVAEMDAGSQWVERVAWNSAGTLLASAAGRVARMWSPDGELVSELPRPNVGIGAIAWEPGHDVLAIGAKGDVQLWAPDAADPIQAFEWESSTIQLVWSPDGAFLVAGGNDGVIRFWVIPTGDEFEIAGYSTKVASLAWNATSNVLATAGGPSVVAWDCTGAGPREKRPSFGRWHRPAVSALTFDPVRGLLASGGEDGRILIWEAFPLTRRREARLEHPVSALAWSPDGALLAAGLADGGLLLFDAPAID